MYVTYRYYADEYGGKLIEEKRFSVMERRAKAYIRQLTYVRGDIFALENDTVKDAVCAAAEVYYQYETNRKTAGTIKSENTDGYSVTYVTEQTDGKTAEEVLKKKAYDAVYPYLLTTGWLSRKVGTYHDHKCRCNDLQQADR